MLLSKTGLANPVRNEPLISFACAAVGGAGFGMVGCVWTLPLRWTYMVKYRLLYDEAV